MSFSRNRSRLALELTKPLNPSLDVFLATSPKMPSGRVWQLELALFSNGTLDPLTSITSIKVEVKTITSGVIDVGTAAVMSQTIGSFNAALTQAAWDDGAPDDCHAVATFSELETGLATGSQNYTDYALIISAQTSIGPVDIGTATLRVIKTGSLTIATPPALGDPTYVRVDDYKADQQGVIKLRNPDGVDMTFVNNLGYAIRLYPTPGSTTPKLEIDIINPAA